MQNLEPPEVPVDLLSQLPVEQPKKQESKGFFKRIFSKKDTPKVTENTNLNFPDIDLPNMEIPSMDTSSFDSNTINSDLNMDLSSPDPVPNFETSANIEQNVPVMPSVSDQLEKLRSNLSNANPIDVPQEKPKSDKMKGKAKGKAKKGHERAIKNIDESSQFDWNREIEDQEILIHDSNRFNQDVNILMSQADSHVEDTMSDTNHDSFNSEHQDLDLNLEELPIQSMNTSLVNPLPEIMQEMPDADPAQQKMFAKLSGNHQKLRNTLNRYLKTPKLFNNRSKMVELFKQYDASIERHIEDKQTELTKKKSYLDRYEKHLKQQESSIKDTHGYMKGLDNKLKEREKQLNAIIADNVEKEIVRRLKAEKTTLRDGLNETVRLNNELKEKVKIIQDDRIRFEREHQRMSEMERKKLTDLQTMYEKKLSELESERKSFEEERKTFEDKRKHAYEVIKEAGAVAKELEYMKQIKASIEDSKKNVERELIEDKELKQAIATAQQTLAQEKENVDKMIFSKYIENKLKSIKPEYLEKRQDWKSELQSHPLYGEIAQCRKSLQQRNIDEAKNSYNTIRRSYEQLQIPPKEKEALYNAIRELYNDIQLKIVETQLHSR